VSAFPCLRATSPPRHELCVGGGRKVIAGVEKVRLFPVAKPEWQTSVGISVRKCRRANRLLRTGPRRGPDRSLNGLRRPTCEDSLPTLGQAWLRE
jgi:hypothetical protein